MEEKKAKQSGEGSAGSPQQFEALFQFATIGIILTDAKGGIVDMNHLAEEQFGYSRQELIGSKIERLLPDRIRKKHIAFRDSYYHHPGQRAMGAGRDLFAQKKDGSVFPVEISLSHFTSDGNLFVIAFIIDITIRKDIEQTMLVQKEEIEKKADEILVLNAGLEKKVEDRTKMLKETLRELEISRDELSTSLEKEKELGDLKSRFVTMASHEFRTPLSTILSSASLLAKYREAEEQDKRDKHIQRIKDNVEIMKSILEDFLSLGKLEEGSVKAKAETIPASDCVEEIAGAISDLQQLCKPGQVILFTHDCSGSVTTDLRLLKNILTNLISNAIKYSPENSKIEVHLELDAYGLHITVRDHGIGIGEEDQHHLFERFFRAKNAVNIQGTGLGLHIVSKYIELLNGRIEMQSTLGKGTAFTVHLPALH